MYNFGGPWLTSVAAPGSHFAWHMKCFGFASACSASTTIHNPKPMESQWPIWFKRYYYFFVAGSSQTYRTPKTDPFILRCPSWETVQTLANVDRWIKVTIDVLSNKKDTRHLPDIWMASDGRRCWPSMVHSHFLWINHGERLSPSYGPPPAHC